MEETGFIVRLYVEHFTARKKMLLCLIITFLVQIHELPAMPRKLNSLFDNVSLLFEPYD